MRAFWIRCLTSYTPTSKHALRIAIKPSDILKYELPNNRFDFDPKVGFNQKYSHLPNSSPFKWGLITKFATWGAIANRNYIDSMRYRVLSTLRTVHALCKRLSIWKSYTHIRQPRAPYGTIRILTIHNFRLGIPICLFVYFDVPHLYYIFIVHLCEYKT